MRHSPGEGSPTEEWLCAFCPRSTNAVYTNQIYLLWGEKNLCKFKVFIIAKDFFCLAQQLFAGCVSIPVFAEQLPFLATARFAKPQEGFAEACP